MTRTRAARGARVPWRIPCALAALTLAACASPPESIPPGTYAAAISGTRSVRDGTWALLIGEGARYRLAFDGQAAVTGRYESDRATVTFIDESGPMMCAAGLTGGTYAWRLEETQLVLEALADDCPGRRDLLHGRAFAAVAPAPAGSS